MSIRFFLPLVLLCTVSACSVYDVAALSSDVALALFTNVNEDKEVWDDDVIQFWDYDTSKCIRVEKSRRSISQQLDAIEEGKDFVILPTGEKYPTQSNSLDDEFLQGPTGYCLSQQSD